jgi:rfaE bifunctional protein kinase chain/domain
VVIDKPKNYLERHEIKEEKLRAVLDKFSTLKVCVIGDIIIDEYITCQPLGMSQEDPTIVVTPIDTTKFIGGAGIVAAHAAGLGASVEFITVTGDDDIHDFAEKGLSDEGVHSHLFKDESRPTTLKQRYRSNNKSLLRVSHLHQSAISSELQKKIKSLMSEIIKKIDVLVFSDFNYGCLPQNLVNDLVDLAKKNNVVLAADSQSSSQIGNISRFKGMDLLTPTEREARISTRNHEDGLNILAEELRTDSQAKNILLKLGEEGMLIYPERLTESEQLPDRIEALNSSPKDVAGAGDSLLITCAMAMACGANIWELSFLGSLAAALQVSRVGNKPLKIFEINNELKKLIDIKQANNI